MKRFILVIISALLLSGCNRLDNHQPLSSHILSFAKANSISQTFVAHRNNLNMVNICLRNSSRSPISLRFTLADQSGAIIRKLDFTGGNIDNFDCTRFQFEKIKDSADRLYTATITTNIDPALEAKDEALLRYGLLIEAHGGGDYLGGTALVDGVEVPYDLHFKTLYYQPLSEVIKESWQGFFLRLTQDPIFFIIFLLLICWVVYRFKKAK